MSDHALHTWLEDAWINTSPLYYLINSTLDDTFGWGERFKKMWNFDPPNGLLLTGPDGCGKHTAAAHMYSLLNDSHYALLLDGRELCADGYAAATRRLRYALDHPRDGYPWCLILEGMEECSFRRELFSWLGLAMNVEWFGDTKNPQPLFLILIDSIAEDLPSILRRHLRLCRMSLPSADRRKAYFTNGSFRVLSGNTVNLDLLVDSTDELTYAQMVDLARNLESALFCLPDGLEKMSDEQLLDFLQEQCPPPSLEDPLQSLALSARQFIEHLPDLLSQLGQNVVSVPAANPATVDRISDPGSNSNSDPALSSSEFEKKIYEMPVKTLSVDLFGKDRHADLLKSRPRS